MIAWHLTCKRQLIESWGETNIRKRPWIATGRTVILTARFQPITLSVWQVVLEPRIQRFAARQVNASRWYFALQQNNKMKEVKKIRD